LRNGNAAPRRRTASAFVLDDKLAQQDASCGESLTHLDRRNRFAAQSDQQHRAHVGVQRKLFQHALRLGQVGADLTATINMRDRDNSWHSLADVFDHGVGAFHRGQHEDVIANADASIFVPVALKRGNVRGRNSGRGATRDGRDFYRCRFVRLTQITASAQAFQIVSMDMLARRNVRRRASDGLAVFEHTLTARDGMQRKLVPAWNGLGQPDLTAVYLNDVTGSQLNHCQRDVILGMHQQSLPSFNGHGASHPMICMQAWRS
jgi:hypothetical protein